MSKVFARDIPYEFLQAGGFIGPRFYGVYYFNNVFWRVAIPLVYGTPTISTLDALQMMPIPVRQQLCSLRANIREYLLLWADCFDYDTGYISYRPILESGSFVGEMIESTERELRSTINDLSQESPNSKAMHSARDATEKALKAYLAHTTALTHDQAKDKFGHNLAKLIKAVETSQPNSPLVAISNDLGVFALYEERYSSTAYSRPHLWRAYRIAQFTAAEVIRSLTGRNQRADVLNNPVFAD